MPASHRDLIRGPAFVTLIGSSRGPWIVTEHGIVRPGALEGPRELRGLVAELEELEPWVLELSGDRTIQGVEGRIYAALGGSVPDLVLPPFSRPAGILRKVGDSLRVVYVPGFRGHFGETGATIAPLTVKRWNRVASIKVSSAAELEAAVEDLQ